MENQRKLVRVELEFDDGEIKSLTGDDAQAWLKQIDDPLVFVQLTRGWKVKDFDWIITNANSGD